MGRDKRWYFTADTNAKGYTYIQAYQTKWDPVAKTTKRSAKRYVGRLFDDGCVKLPEWNRISLKLERFKLALPPGSITWVGLASASGGGISQ